VRILLVAATSAEVAPLIQRFRLVSETGARSVAYTFRGHDVHVLTSGVGMVATAAWCSRALAVDEYDMALNLGVCGSFDPAFRPGTVLHITSERMSELGAEDGDEFLTIHDLQLLDEDEFPFEGGMLVNAAPPQLAPITELPVAAGITVNTGHGSDATIRRVRDRFQPQVESMEGAGFMYACLMSGVPFAEIRAVSNVVERRNRSAWKIGAAIDALCDRALLILESA
jgi:futalosine hydrolase